MIEAKSPIPTRIGVLSASGASVDVSNHDGAAMSADNKVNVIAGFQSLEHFLGRDMENHMHGRHPYAVIGSSQLRMKNADRP